MTKQELENKALETAESNMDAIKSLITLTDTQAKLIKNRLITSYLHGYGEGVNESQKILNDGRTDKES